MCGIYGVIGPGIIKADLKVFYDLAFVNQLRGMDSCGVLRVYNKIGPNGKWRTSVKKDTSCAYNFLNEKENQSIIEDISPVAVMGHNRHATVGASDDIRGAHPFETSKYIGFHNGTLVESKYTKSTEYLTDSEALWNDITGNGLKETLTPLSKDSAFALAYFDKDAGEVGFVRNEKRPLAFATNQQRSVFYYSSELEALEFVLERNNIDYESYSLSPWCSIRTVPNQFSFTPSKKNQSVRVNTWYLENFTPNPVEPPPVNTVVNTDHWLNNKYKGAQCPGCKDELIWATSTNGRDYRHNPKYVYSKGFACSNCADWIGDLDKPLHYHASTAN